MKRQIICNPRRYGKNTLWREWVKQNPEQYQAWRKSLRLWADEEDKRRADKWRSTLKSDDRSHWVVVPTGNFDWKTVPDYAAEQARMIKFILWGIGWASDDKNPKEPE